MMRLYRKIRNYILLILIVVLFTGCSIFVPKEEADLQYAYDMYGLDFTKGDRLYLNYNLWYVNPMAIDAVNYHTGKILPVGDEIEFIKTFPNYVIFKTVKDGKEYRINNNTEFSLLNDKIQFHRIFINKDPLAYIDNKKLISLLRKGKIVIGMSRKHVKLAFGLPPRAFNPPESNTTWVYFIDAQFKATHVVFNKKNRVIYVFDC